MIDVEPILSSRVPIHNCRMLLHVLASFGRMTPSLLEDVPLVASRLSNPGRSFCCQFRACRRCRSGFRRIGEVDNNRDEISGSARQGSPFTPEKAGAIAKELPWHARLVKFGVTSGNLSGLANWGGSHWIVGNDERVLADRVFPQDMSALAWFGGMSIVGLADGFGMGMAKR